MHEIFQRRCCISYNIPIVAIQVSRDIPTYKSKSLVGIQRYTEILRNTNTKSAYIFMSSLYLGVFHLSGPSDGYFHTSLLSSILIHFSARDHDL